MLNEIEARSSASLNDIIQIEPDDDLSSDEKDPTEPSDCDSIPEEHDDEITYREYTRRYALRITSITHGLNSHGLFDFEKLQGVRESFMTSKAANLVRKSEHIQLVPPTVDIQTKFESRAQMLMQIETVRNTFRLKTPILYLLKNAKTEREKDFIKNKEIENFYNE
jgi:hypothetical protein